MKLYYDPNTPPGQAPVVAPVVVVPPATPAAPVTPAVPVADVVPRTKEEWNNLAKDNPQRWIELTQANMDRTTREARETKEQLERERKQRENIEAELNQYKKPNLTVPQGQQFTLNNPPQSQEQWDQLFLEAPTYATDLRNAYFAKQNSETVNFQRAWKTSAEEVQDAHPDMYVPKVDPVTGQAIKDGNGKPILALDNNGFPILDSNSEKGKLWLEIWSENQRPDGTNPLTTVPNTPRLMKAMLEQKLYERGKAVMNNVAPEVRQNQVAPEGVPPPQKNVQVKFNDESERLRAEKAVQNGVYDSLEQFCQVRDQGVGIQPIYDTNRRPDFSKR